MEFLIGLKNSRLSKYVISDLCSPTFPSLSAFVCGLFNADRHSAPTARSARTAGVLTLAYVCAAAALAGLMENADHVGGVALQVCAGILAFFMTACLFFLSLQPKTTQKMAFKVRQRLLFCTILLSICWSAFASPISCCITYGLVYVLFSFISFLFDSMLSPIMHVQESFIFCRSLWSPFCPACPFS